MQGSSTHAGARVLLPLLVLLLLTPPAAAQVPQPDTSQDYYAVNLRPEQGSAYIDFLGTANIPVAVEDVSVDPETVTNPPREPNQIHLTVDVVGNDTQGWAAGLSRLSIQTEPGETHQLLLTIQAGATIETPTVEVRIQAVYDPRVGQETVTNTSVLAVAKSFPSLNMQMGEIPETFEPDDMRAVPITVTNNNYYPDMVSFRVSQPDGWLVSPPSSIRLSPGETKTVYVDVKAPENPWFRYTTTSDLFTVEAISETSGQPLVSVGVPVTQGGVNFPGWAGPQLLMLLIGAATIVKRRRRKRADRKLEKGKPSYPGLDPEHEAELEAMKIEDPEQAEVLEDRLETLYEKRKQAWKKAYERRQSAEDELSEIYEDRHDALVDAREAPSEDPERVQRRKQLLEKKRQLLERKRQALTEGEGSQPPDEAS